MIIITKILGMTLVALFLIGLAVEAAVKMTSALLIAAFWGLTLLGYWAISSFLFHKFRKQ